MDDVTGHFGKINSFLQMEKLQEAKVEMNNLRMNLFAMLNKINTKSLCFACLIVSIDGEQRNDLSDDGLKTTVSMIEKTGITYEEIESELSASKKKSKTN